MKVEKENTHKNATRHSLDGHLICSSSDKMSSVAVQCYRFTLIDLNRNSICFISVQMSPLNAPIDVNKNVDHIR